MKTTSMGVPSERMTFHRAPRRVALQKVWWGVACGVDTNMLAILSCLPKRASCPLCNPCRYLILFPTRVFFIVTNMLLCVAMFPLRTLVKLPHLLRVLCEHIGVALRTP